MYANKIAKIKTLIEHPTTPEFERQAAIAVLNSLEEKRKKHPWYQKQVRIYKFKPLDKYV